MWYLSQYSADGKISKGKVFRKHKCNDGSRECSKINGDKGTRI